MRRASSRSSPRSAAAAGIPPPSRRESRASPPFAYGPASRSTKSSTNSKGSAARGSRSTTENASTRSPTRSRRRSSGTSGCRRPACSRPSRRTTRRPARSRRTASSRRNPATPRSSSGKAWSRSARSAASTSSSKRAASSATPAGTRSADPTGVERPKPAGAVRKAVARVLFSVAMDAERRAVLASKATAGLEAVILADLPPSERDAAWASAEVLVCTGFGSELPRDLASRAPRLRMIQALLAGVDNLPFDRFPRTAIVCSNAGAYTTSVAEHAMALLLAASKDVVARTEEIRRGIFDQGVVNKALAGSTFLRAMKPDAVLVNIARGKVVVEDDLFDHLRTHPAFRAALDVWWTYPDTKRGRPFRRPFHELPNVLMTPHAANAIPTQRREAMESAIDNVLRFLRGETPRNVVDPEEYA